MRLAAWGRSLRFRLAIAGLALLAIVFVIAFFGVSYLFERHVERRVATELELHLDQIIAGLEPGRAGGLRLARDPVDPRFAQPLSGLYWQVEQGEATLRSRSLWDGALDLPQLEPGAIAVRSAASPGGRPLILVGRAIIGGPRLGNEPIRAAVALDRSDIDRAVAAFRADMIPYFIGFAILLVTANLLQIHVGLAPLSVLRARIAEIGAGGRQRMGSDYPSEIQPLTDEVDALLASREEQLQRARRQAADLAHGLKTPLQALAGDVEHLRAAGQEKIARDIGQSIAAMQRHIDHQLARARMANRALDGSSRIQRVVMQVLAVIERTPRGQLLEWNLEIEEDLAARLDAEDLAEVLGNLLENASRYAETAVTVAARALGAVLEIIVRDDGPGIPEDRFDEVLGRGGRIDTSSGGAGLGLAIVDEIVRASGGEISIANAAPGLAVTITLPRADSRRRVL